ncbi:MAG: hypothetical protein OXQ29_18735 [Rhodospirillaceae bacterium]|nr:hypothetical protein [Rhodospirillaceae bacterium]
MNLVMPKRRFDRLGLVSVLDTELRFQRRHEPPYTDTYVLAWEDGWRNPAS